MKRIMISFSCCIFAGAFSLSSALQTPRPKTTSKGTVEKIIANTTIRGRIIDAETGIPLLGANILAVGGTSAGSTESSAGGMRMRGVASVENGEYTLLLTDGTYTLRVKYPGYRTEDSRVTVVAKRDLTVDFALQKDSEPPRQDPKTDNDTYFVVVEQMPELIGGIRAVQERVIYPVIAKRAGIEGLVIVEVFIDERGNVVKTSIIQGIGAGCDQAAMAAILTARFRPGIQGGKPVKTRISIPIRFKLNPEEAAIKANYEKLHNTIKEPTITVVAGPKGLKRYITYPSEAVKNNAQGVVYVDARLNVEKKTVGVNLKRGVAFGVDQDVMRAVMNYNFFEDPEIPKPQSDTTISIVVQFLMPQKK